MSHITIAELALWRRARFAHTLIDVRRAAARGSDSTGIPGASWRDPAAWLDWKDQVSREVPAVLYCVHGHEVSQGLAAALRALGIDARHLSGGIGAWKTAGEPVEAIGEENMR